MSDVLIVLSIFLGAFVTVFLLAFISSWLTHIDMNKGENKPYDWCTFSTFKKEFDKYKDNPKLEKAAFTGESIFLRENLHYIVYLHADIVKFDEKCMILYPHSYLAYHIWKHNFNKKSNRQKGLWK